MIRSVGIPLLAGLLCLTGAVALAQDTGGGTVPGATDARLGAKAAPETQPAAAATTVRQPLPPASQAVQRGQRSFKRCNEEALKRKLSGAERRHFVTRCRLGYGRRLFRRRGVPPA